MLAFVLLLAGVGPAAANHAQDAVADAVTACTAEDPEACAGAAQGIPTAAIEDVEDAGDPNGLCDDPETETFPDCLEVPDLPAGDGFIAHFSIPDVSTTGALPIVDLGEDLAIDVSAFTFDAEGMTPWEGGLVLFIQRDCQAVGDLGLIPEGPAGQVCSFTNADYIVFDAMVQGAPGQYSITFSAADLATLFIDGVPTTAVHLWVAHDTGGVNGLSHYSAPKEALLSVAAADPSDGAAILIHQFVDTGDSMFWHPLLIAAAGELPIPRGDGFVAVMDLPPVISADADLEVTITIYAADEAGVWAAAGGTSHGFVLKNDCGAATPAAEPLGCTPQDNITSAPVYSFTSEIGGASVTVPAADLRALLGENSAAGVHAWVQGAGHAPSNHAVPTALAVQAAADTAARDAILGLADMGDEQFWHPVPLVGSTVSTGDSGFTAHLSIAGAVTEPAGIILLADPDGDIHVEAGLYASGDEGYESIATGTYALRLYYLDGDGEIQRIPADNLDPAYLDHDVADGQATFSFPSSDLPVSQLGAGNGFMVQLIQLDGPGRSTSDWSNLFVPKEAALAAAQAGADPLFAVADAMDNAVIGPGGQDLTPFTPLFVIENDAVPHVDGLVAQIEPRHSLRTPLGSIVEANIGNQFIFDVCLFDENDAPYGFADFRLELWGVPRDAEAAEPTTVYMAGTSADWDQQLAPNNGDNCHNIAISASAVSGLAAPNRMLHVSIWVPHAGTEIYAMYTETGNALLAAGNAAEANVVDRLSASGVWLMDRRTNPLGEGDLSTSRLANDPTGAPADLEAIAGHLIESLGGVPEPTCPPEAPGEFPACEPEGVPQPGDPCPEPLTGTFPECAPVVPSLDDLCPEGSEGPFPDCLGAPGADALCAVGDDPEGTFPECLGEAPGPDDACPEGSEGPFPDCLTTGVPPVPDSCPPDTTGDFPACVPDGIPPEGIPPAPTSQPGPFSSIFSSISSFLSRVVV